MNSIVFFFLVVFSIICSPIVVIFSLVTHLPVLPFIVYGLFTGIFGTIDSGTINSGNFIRGIAGVNGLQFNSFDQLNQLNQINSQLTIDKQMLISLMEKDLLGNKSGIIQYGNWCGALHGGYQDCNNGKPSPSCDITNPGMTLDCLKECPPVDELDFQCAVHDLCTFRQIGNIQCSPQGNFCGCDCIFSNRVSKSNCTASATPKSCAFAQYTIQKIFQSSLGCWYIDSLTKQQKCDGLAGGIPLDSFCPVDVLTPYGYYNLPDESVPNSYSNYNLKTQTLEYPCFDGFLC